MTLRRVAASVVCSLLLAACGGASKNAPPPPPPVEEPEPEEPPPDPPTTTNTSASPPSTATYEQAMSVPEPLDVNDARAQLNDAQLTGPMRGVINSCKVPSNARVTIKTAVQNGRAIGVTVTVRIERPKSKRPPPRSVVKADAKLSAQITTCVDKAVRVQTWPPSKRRDSFTTEF